MKKSLLIGLIASSMFGASSVMAASLSAIDYSAEIAQKVAASQAKLSVHTRGLLAKMLLNPTEDNTYQFMESAKKDREAQAQDADANDYTSIRWGFNELGQSSGPYEIGGGLLTQGHNFTANTQPLNISPPSVKNGGGGIDMSLGRHSEPAYSEGEPLITQFQTLISNDRFYPYSLALQSVSPAVYRALVNDEFLRLKISQQLVSEEQTNLLKKIERNQETLIHLLSHTTNRSSGSL